MAEIQFGTPDSSSVYPFSLGSPRPTVAARFFEFVPDYSVVGPRKTTLDRTQHVFALREDFSARIVVKHLDPSQLSTALALKAWMIAGNAVNVVTDDDDDNDYVCVLRPGTTPTITNDDDRRQHFSFACEVAGDTAILVEYEV